MYPSKIVRFTFMIFNWGTYSLILLGVLDHMPCISTRLVELFELRISGGAIIQDTNCVGIFLVQRLWEISSCLFGLE